MSLFSEAFSALAGAAQGGQGSLAQEALSLIDNQPGGLSGLLQQFESNGLGSVVQSWVGNGANLPVSGDDIQQVLGGVVVGVNLVAYALAYRALRRQAVTQSAWRSRS